MLAQIKSSGRDSRLGGNVWGISRSVCERRFLYALHRRKLRLSEAHLKWKSFSQRNNLFFSRPAKTINLASPWCCVYEQSPSWEIKINRPGCHSPEPTKHLLCPVAKAERHKHQEPAFCTPICILLQETMHIAGKIFLFVFQQREQIILPCVCLSYKIEVESYKYRKMHKNDFGY